MINRARVTNCFRYTFVMVICFSLMGKCHGGTGLCIAPHNNVDMEDISRTVHGAPVHSHLPSGHESHQVGSSQQCCQSPLKIPADCLRIFALPNKTEIVQGPLIATLSAQIAISRFQLSEKNLISEIANTINPTLVTLRTVILLV
ncbi:MAG: hypothetical protein ACYSW4_00985 [Planctomycetota bacterium]